MKLWIIYVSTVIVLTITLIPFAFSYDNEFSLNQFFIQEKMLEYNTYSSTELVDYLVSKYLYGWNNIFFKNQEVIFEDPNSVFNYVFQKLSYFSIVYPSESYYYYQFNTDYGTISGNLRLLDAAEGKIHIGYFMLENSTLSNSATFVEKDDLVINMVNENLINVIHNGKSVYFKFDDRWMKTTEGLKTLESEEFVTRIQDESGFRFFLLYNSDINGFYYVLDDERGHEDDFYKYNDKYRAGKTSGYVFYDDLENQRKILVGVHKQNIYTNNYYDGPFDQVPPRLQLREKLLLAYPYVGYGGGIDQYGNFNNFFGTRVAISPYYDYESLDDLKRYHSRCEGSNFTKTEFIGCLTYEWKKDFHKYLERTNQTNIHQIFVSQGWPANHHGDVSITWPNDHQKASSELWPPNHDSKTSISGVSEPEFLNFIATNIEN